MKTLPGFTWGASMDPQIRTFHKTKLCEVFCPYPKRSLHNWNELGWYLHIVEQTYLSKVQIFWEGQKSMVHFPLIIWCCFKFVWPSQIIWTLLGRCPNEFDLLAIESNFFLNEAENWASDVVQTISWKKQRLQVANISMKSRAKIKGTSPRPFPRILIRC